MNNGWGVSPTHHLWDLLGTLMTTFSPLLCRMFLVRVLKQTTNVTRWSPRNQHAKEELDNTQVHRTKSSLTNPLRQPYRKFTCTKRRWEDFLKGGFALIPHPLTLSPAQALTPGSPWLTEPSSRVQCLPWSGLALCFYISHVKSKVLSQTVVKTHCTTGPQYLITPTTPSLPHYSLSSRPQRLFQKAPGTPGLQALDMRPVLIKMCYEGDTYQALKTWYRNKISC